MFKRTELRICGLGGQGVVLAGRILGRAAVYDGKHVVQTQSYGAEARGSAAKSEVIISDRRIGFPMVRRCDVLVAMSQSALDKHLKDLKEGGTLIVDEDMVKEVPEVKAKVFRAPATRMAKRKLGLQIYANVIILGFLTAITNIVSTDAMRRAIIDTVPAEAREINLHGFEIGLKLAKEQLT